MAKPILEVKNLVTQFKTESGIVRAVDDISFTLHKGETVGIVGESGSGKSVTSLSVMRLIPNPPGKIVNGEILFQSPTLGETNLRELSDSNMRHVRGNEISMIFQEPMTSLNPVFKCGEQVVEAIRLHEDLTKLEARTRTMRLFEQVKLPDIQRIFDAYPHQISGGQKQRVMIAMAMACSPSILIADEPTTALDVTVQSAILRLMADLRDNLDMSILFITHDLGVIAEIADRVIVMYKGKIVEQGPVLDIFKDPQHPYTKGLLACRPRLDKRLKILPTISSFMSGVDGNLDQSIEAVLNSVGVSDQEYRDRQKELASKKPILEVKDLHTWFPNRSGFFSRVTSHVKAVDGVSFEVYPGETMGLVGESGCGKTTLGRTILRLVDPTSGQVIFDGKDITSMNEDQMRIVREDIQIIFQDPYSSLNPRITVGNAILEPMRVHNLHDNDEQRKEKVFELLKRVNLYPEHYNRYPHEFSGGQRQRVCIARALALNPKFIICDESVSALDVSVQARVLNLLNELRDEFNFTYIFISHDLSVVKFMSDRMIVMNNGKVEEMGYSEDIYANPEKEYTQKLIEAIPKGRIKDIEEALSDRKKKREGRHIEL